MKPRILIFSTAYLPLVGGAEVAVKEITDRLGDSFDFVMITARLDAKVARTEKIGNVEVHRLGSGSRLDKFRLIIEGAHYATKLGHFDAIWSIMASYAGFAALNYKQAHPSTPYLLTLQEGDSKWHVYKHVWWCWLYFKQIFTRADRIQAISTYLATWAKEMGAKCPVEVVPNGVDLTKFQFPISNFQLNSNYGTEIKKQLRNKIGLPLDARLVITVSRLVPKNGIEDLIRSAVFLPEKIHFLIAGTGELLSHLKSVVAELHLEKRVHFLGTVSQEELPGFLWGSDVFCRPSLSEGLGIAFLEAMAVGMPVIATPVGGIPDFLKNGETGWLCQVKNPESIAAKIKYVLDDAHREEVARVTTNALKMIQHTYSWEIIAVKMKDVFDNLCNSLKSV